MKNLFVTTHIAKRLDILQYNEPCLGYYTTNDDDGDGVDVHIIDKPLRNSDLINDAFSAPTYQQVVDWFRDKNKLLIVTTHATQKNKYVSIIYKEWNNEIYSTLYYYDNYYESLNKAIEEALKLI